MEYQEQLCPRRPSQSGGIYVAGDGRVNLVTVVMAGFGRAIAEVGAVLIVGGNIAELTRVMTTTIALETHKGNLAIALALIVSFGAIGLNAAAYTLGGGFAYWRI